MHGIWYLNLCDNASQKNITPYHPGDNSLLASTQKCAFRVTWIPILSLSKWRSKQCVERLCTFFVLHSTISVGQQCGKSSVHYMMQFFYSFSYYRQMVSYNIKTTKIEQQKTSPELAVIPNPRYLYGIWFFLSFLPFIFSFQCFAMYNNISYDLKFRFSRNAGKKISISIYPSYNEFRKQIKVLSYLLPATAVISRNFKI